MKRIFLLAMVFAIACNSSKNGDTKADSSSATTTETSSDAGDEDKGTITFKANGETVNTSVLNLAGFQFPNSPKGLNITSDMNKDKRVVNMNVSSYAAGDYTFKEEGITKTSMTMGMYFPNYSQANDPYTFISGHVNISKFDTVNNVMEGTFSGIVKNSEGKTIEITDGIIKNGKISPMQEMPK